MEILEEAVMEEDMEDTPKEYPSKPCTKSCYSCGEGHISQNCLNGDLVEFPTEEVEYDPQEIEALIGTEKSRKRSRLDPRTNPISTKRDLSHITCFRCKNSGHYHNDCPKGKPRYLSEVVCFSCNGAGHFAKECPKEKETCAR